jgi:cystathionine beta-synthase
MCGTAKYLKEQNDKIVTVGIDTYGSVFKKYKETGVFDEKEIYPYLTEGIGEDILPKNVDFDMIDHFIKVTDKDAAVMTRRLAREEGLFIGWSCGSAVHGALEYAKENLGDEDVMVIILPDHGTRYLGKVYNDGWMKNHGFLESRSFGTAKDIIDKRGSYNLFSIPSDAKVSEAIQLMQDRAISQAPVSKGDEIIGSLRDSNVLQHLIQNPDTKEKPVSEIMEKPFPFIGLGDTADTISSMLDHQTRALMVRDNENKPHIITKQDLLVLLSS